MTEVIFGLLIATIDFNSKESKLSLFNSSRIIFIICSSFTIFFFLEILWLMKLELIIQTIQILMDKIR